jgi:hypothetical protein
MPSNTKTTKTAPPAQAVAADPHWTATRERLAARTRPTARMTICDDHAVKETLSRAQFAARTAKAAVDATDTPENQAAFETAQTGLEAAQAAFDEAAIVLKFQALERPMLERLKKEHQPTEEQAEEGFVFNVDTFAPALIAAASLDGMTEADARHYLDTWSEAEAISLWNTAYGVQGDASRLDVGKG